MRIFPILLTITLTLSLGCSEVRERPLLDGVHPDGWADVDSTDFHGVWLSDNGHPLADCRSCHGADDLGGDVDISCSNAGCHTEGVDACGTCHGTFASNPMPATGAHSNHVGLCENCHQIPATVATSGHINGTVDVAFSGLAVTNNATPSWDASSGTCNNSYCHASGALSWRDPPSLDCGSCHGEPPVSHSRFERTATVGSCTSCHPDSSLASHVNGSVEMTSNRCDQCHGENNRSSPPLALDGSTLATSSGVGAHVRHLDATLAGRIGSTVRCDQCHSVPTAITSAGHIDLSAPADVTLPQGGVYDSTTQTCQAWCHWNRDPGPSWTDNSGAARACDACHDFPMTITRAGTPHPSTAPDVAVCVGCHLFSPTTHVNGTVDFDFALQ